MKNLQKGFIIPIIIVLMALVGMGGVYSYIKNENSSLKNNEVPLPDVNSSSTVKNINKTSVSSLNSNFLEQANKFGEQKDCSDEARQTYNLAQKTGGEKVDGYILYCQKKLMLFDERKAYFEQLKNQASNEVGKLIFDYKISYLYFELKDYNQATTLVDAILNKLSQIIYGRDISYNVIDADINPKTGLKQTRSTTITVNIFETKLEQFKKDIDRASGKLRQDMELLYSKINTGNLTKEELLTLSDYYKKSDPEKAQIALEKLSQLNLGDYQTDMKLVTSYRDTSEFDKARAVLEERLKQSPGDVVIFQQIAVLYIKEGLIDEGLAYAENNLKTQNSAFEKQLLASIYVNAYNQVANSTYADKAISYIDQAINQESENNSYKYSKANTLIMLRKYQEAKVYLEQYIDFLNKGVNNEQDLVNANEELQRVKSILGI